MVQRSLVLFGNVSNVLSKRRGEVVLDAVQPSLNMCAKGDFTEAGSDLFGGKTVSRGTKVYKNPQAVHRGKITLFRAGLVGTGMCLAECTACINYTAATQKRKCLQVSWPATRQECTRSDLRPTN